MLLIASACIVIHITKINFLITFHIIRDIILGKTIFFNISKDSNCKQNVENINLNGKSDDNILTSL